MRTINDINDLPPRPDIVRLDRDTAYHTAQIFLRSKSEPKVLIDYHDGECYRRADGENWEWPAYTREREINLVNGVRTPTPWTKPKGCPAYCDDKTYPRAKERAAA